MAFRQSGNRSDCRVKSLKELNHRAEEAEVVTLGLLQVAGLRRYQAGRARAAPSFPRRFFMGLEATS
jgi:hypothetical protein